MAAASDECRRGRAKARRTRFTIPGAAVVPWIACAVIVWLLTGVTSVEWLGFVICVAVASMVLHGDAHSEPRFLVPTFLGA